MIRYAPDEFGNWTFIDDCLKEREYHCPICKKKLEVRKNGTMRAHYFAHWKNQKCTDSWIYHPMTKWHLEWQERFDKQYRERSVPALHPKHRADILIPDNELEIEFQHSSITLKAFRDRNRFYTQCGYKVIWVFDMIETFQKGAFFVNENTYSWEVPDVLFQEIKNIKLEKATVYFQIAESGENSLLCIYDLKDGFQKFSVNNYRNQSIESFVDNALNNPSAIIQKRFGSPITWLSDSSCRVIYVENIITGEIYNIWVENGEVDRDASGKITGYLSTDPMGSKYKKAIIDAEKPVWVLHHKEDKGYRKK